MRGSFSVLTDPNFLAPVAPSAQDLQDQAQEFQDQVQENTSTDQPAATEGTLNCNII